MSEDEVETPDEDEDEVQTKDIEAAFRTGTGIDRALRRAVALALREHKKLSNPVAVGQHGKVVWIPPEQIPVDDEPLRPKSQ